MSTQVYSYSELQAVILHLSQCLNPAPQPLEMVLKLLSQGSEGDAGGECTKLMAFELGGI